MGHDVFWETILVKGFAAIKYFYIHTYIILPNTKLRSDRLLVTFEKENKNVSSNKILNVSQQEAVSTLLCKMLSFTL